MLFKQVNNLVTYRPHMSTNLKADCLKLSNFYISKWALSVSSRADRQSNSLAFQGAKASTYKTTLAWDYCKAFSNANTENAISVNNP